MLVRADRLSERTGLREAVGTLQEAVQDQGYDPIAICDAFRAFEKNKLQFDDLGEAIGGGTGGKHWQLQFVTRKRQMAKGARGGAYRFPITAVQNFDNGRIINGVYLGYIASMKFEGTYEIKKSLMSFTFNTMELMLGPLTLTFPVSKGPSMTGKFVFFYVDDDFVVARGETGGTAFWKRLTSSDLLVMGVA